MKLQINTQNKIISFHLKFEPAGSYGPACIFIK